MALFACTTAKAPRLLVTDDEPLAPSEVGEKLARQRTMAQAGLPVPRFFCLTRAAFERAFGPEREPIRALLAGVDFGNADAVREAAAQVQARVKALALDPALSAEVLERFDRMFGADALVAVRTSTVGDKLEESEDSADNPFAGMSETFLYVRRDQVLGRIQECWASGLSQESLLYRHAQGMDLLGFGVAVAVQRMVFGARSFVLFTANPKNGSRDSVVVAGHGIGEGVVQEKVGVDHYFVNALTSQITRELGDKSDRLTFDRARGHGLVCEDVPETQRTAPVLSDEELKMLVDCGQRIAQLFGSPQDIEGTFLESGELFFLQSRPIAIDYRRLSIFTNANVTESFPGVTTALTYTHARYFYRVIFYDCYRRLGLSTRGLHDNHDEYLERMIGFLEGRVYYNLNAFYHLHSQSPIFPIFRSHWERMMGFRSSYRPVAETAWERALDATRGAASSAVAASMLALRFATHERGMRHFHAFWEQLIAPMRGKSFEGEDPLILVREFHRVWRAVGREWGITLLNDTYLPLLYGLVQSLFQRWGLKGDEALLNDLLCGDEELWSVDIILSAVRLAEQVRTDAGLRARFEVETPEALYAALARGELDASFTAAVHTHLHCYGDRGLMELKMEQPNLRHTPELLLRTVQGYLAGDMTVQGMRDKERAVRKGADERLDAKLGRSSFEARTLRVLLDVLRGLIRHRENSRYCRSELFGFSKNVFRALGQALVKREVLASVDDVFHLTQDELFGYFDGTGVTDDLAALVAIRRREQAAREAVDTPMEITTLGAVRDNQLRVVEPVEAGEGVFSGIGSSAGKARGRARVVLDPNTIQRLEPDTVLIARETDPGWLFLMLASRAIVVERGSMLSHTAITGRKFGIPTVVSVPGATKRIPDGALVEVDGATGVVTVLRLPAAELRPEVHA